ncbi:lytic transglycosylase domain-containing protein [Pseudorhodoferax sp. Leaf267]|uniref:lytic transglycosylase domain-containing protein n=1 Tax=Pseudorhodoferax sp. Leaf267 TaxID=1736316 RepID=UPI0006FBAE9E|nr:lytic transglycosylase domain-containing protein [Pseudorhodoferax sp. Leaf267]KQP23379.1 lytic transglycosylase [Pseudorhodoferax sp. Leaf267]
MRVVLVLVLAVLAMASAHAVPCWEHAAQRYGIAPELLRAMAHIESNLDASAVNRRHQKRTRSYDIGLMQINSRHLPQLARHGIQEADLYDACTNLQVGAWLLADLFARHGVNWQAVGAYNAACNALQGDACVRARATYAWRVYRHLPVDASLGNASNAVKPAKAQDIVLVRPQALSVRVTP